MGDKPRRHSASHINLGSEHTPRLTLIAPKAEHGSQPSQFSPVTRPESASGIYGKDKLPPRSRTGCWTCRTRKVKCDEKHPRCGQCSRLQHQCDYSPRLSFRDDTTRIVERMQDVKTAGSVIWDSSARSKANPNFRRSLDLSQDFPLDVQALPPFSELTNDEEREMKAATRLPGTYTLVCNPSSFSAIDEDQDEMDEDGRITPIGSRIKREDADGDLNIPDSSAALRNLVLTSSQDSVSDPDIVILRRFEEPILKSPTASTHPKLKTSPGSNHSIPSLSGLDITSKEPEVPLVLLPNAITMNDEKYLQYYKEVLVPQLINIRGLQGVWDISLEAGELFGQELLNFPPLFHAIMALAAFSIRDETSIRDSLQHFQIALPSLQSSLQSGIDILGNGVLYTHFFLLLYEIATVEPGKECLWQQHLSHIRYILLSRGEPPSDDTTYFIIWFILVVDIYASLSSGTESELTDIFLKANMVPNGKLLLVSRLNKDMDVQMFYSTAYGKQEMEMLRQLLSLNQGLVLIGGSIAKMAQLLRDPTPLDDVFFTEDEALFSDQMDLNFKQAQIQSTIVELKTIWFFHQKELTELEMEGIPALSPKVTVLNSQAKLLYQACLIYVHTSMWTGQRGVIDQNSAIEVDTAIQVIVDECGKIIGQRALFLNLGFMLFPLFLAGFASTQSTQKMWILEILGTIEDGTIGRNGNTMRDALQLTYQRQNDAIMNVGHSLNVDWQQVLSELGTSVATFGL